MPAWPWSACPTAVQDAIDAGTYEPSDALTFAKYADRPDVIDAVLADNYRSGSDLDWRLQRAAEALDAAEYRQAMLDQCAARRVGRATRATTRPAPTAAPSRSASSASPTPTTPASPAT